MEAFEKCDVFESGGFANNSVIKASFINKGAVIRENRVSYFIAKF